MKKLHYFLSLLSLLLIGAVSAQVQAQTTYPAWKSVYYAAEQPVAFSDIKFDGKTPYVVRGIHSSDFGAPESANFLADGKYAAEATDVYVFEPTGEQVDGHDTYYLKNFQTGQYLRYNESTLLNMDMSPKGEAVNGASIVWVSDKEQAAKMTILQAQGDNPSDFRSYCVNKTADVAAWHENSITLVFDKSDEDGNFYGLNCMTSPVYSTYKDTKAWDVYTAEEAKPYESLASLLMQISATPNAFAAGTAPGLYPQNLVEAYDAAYTKADALTQLEAATLEECKAAYEALAAAKAAVEDAIIMPQVGKWYYIKSGRPSYAYSNGSGMMANLGYTEPAAADITGTSPQYWWKLTLAKDGKSYNIQNGYDDKYVGFRSDVNYKEFPMVAVPNETFTIAPATKIPNVTGQFTIISVSNKMQMHGDQDGRIVRWNSIAAVAGGFQFIEVPADVVAAGEALVVQEKINGRMNELLPVVTNFVQKNMTYKEPFDFTDLTQSPNGLITSGNQLKSNAPESGEGSYQGLIDGKIGTQGSGDADLLQQYFHSSWSNTTASDNRAHALSIDLGKEVQSFTMRAAMRNNNGVNDLKTFNLYTSDDSITWSYAGMYSINYKFTCTNPEGYKDWNNWKKSTNNVGIAGFTLAKPQRYLRIEKVSDIGNDTDPFWYLSELQLFEGVTPDTDPANSPLYNSEVSAETRTALLNALAEANAEKPGLTFTTNADGSVTVTEGTYKASEALVDKIQSLYNELLKVVPDVDAFKTQLDSIKNAGLAMRVGTEIGYFQQADKDEFETAFANVETAVTPTMTVEEIKASREQALAALNKFKTTFNMPTEGKVYALRCAADYDGGEAVKNAIAYSDGTDTTTWIRERGDSVSVAGQEGKVQVDVNSDVRYLWLAEKVNGKNIVLRNLGTGMYLGKPDSAANDVYIPNSATPYEQPLAFSGRSGVLNMPVADGFFVNFHGGGNGYGLVVWQANNSIGDSITGSSIKFEEISESAGSFDEMAWNLGDRNVGAYQIRTLPFNGEVAAGETYTVLGQRKDGDSYTLELNSTGGEFQAGVPFVYVTTEDDSLANEIALYRMTSGLQELVEDLPNLVTTGEHKSDALVGVMLNDTLKNVVSGTSVFDGKEVHAITGRQSWRGYEIYGNTGYILPVETEEVGDLSIPLEAALTTGITEAELNANSTVDVYTISGVKVRKNVKAASATAGLPAGIYVVGGQKVLVK